MDCCVLTGSAVGLDVVEPSSQYFNLPLAAAIMKYQCQLVVPETEIQTPRLWCRPPSHHLLCANKMPGSKTVIFIIFSFKNASFNEENNLIRQICV